MSEVSASPRSATSALWTRDTLNSFIASHLGRRKLIVVGNREPYIHRYQGDAIECLRPAGGMTAALDPILAATGGTWIAHGSGDADRAVVDASDRIQVPPEDPSYTLRRVWLTEQQERGFYYGLANEGLWPLCHLTFTRPVFRESDWEAYREVNAIFAEAVIKEAGSNPALVFIQDYHFALLPRMLKNFSGGGLVVSQFWHIPWPDKQTFRAFPWQEELLDGLLGNDVLGFQIPTHCRNFLDTVDRTLEARVDPVSSEISRRDALTRVRSFPISMDFAAHAAQAASPAVDAAMKKWRRRLQPDQRKLGLGLERLDYTKGIPERLKGLDLLLEKHPEWRGCVTFVQAAAPSRSQLSAYRDIEQQIDELVGEINDRWGDSSWQPIVLLKEHLDPVDMLALHRISAFCVVSSLHDGMNLVAKEFVASRLDERGVLILSRFAGAHHELSGSLSINPFAIHEIADAMRSALAMPVHQQRDRMARMRNQVASHNIYRWAVDCLSAQLQVDSSASLGAAEPALRLVA